MMFEEPNKDTVNMRFIRDGKSSIGYRVEKVTRNDLNRLRSKVDTSKFMPIGRSCWECNPAHVHHLDSGGEYNCFACGRFYMDGVDVTDYTGSELESFSDSNLLEEKEWNYGTK